MATLGTSLRLTAVVVAAMFTLGAGESIQPTWSLPADVKTVTVNGYPMAYVERGAGPSLVLVHGAVSDYRTWHGQLSTLSSRFRVIAVSLRRYFPERWDGKGQDFSEQQHAADIASFLERLGPSPVYLVGHSRGGMVAILAARSRPGLVRKLVLMEAPLTALDPAYKNTEDPRIARWQKTAKLFETDGIDTGLEFFVDDVAGAGTWKRFTDERRQAIRDNAWTIAGQLSDTATISCADVGALKMPVMLVVGEKTTRQFMQIVEATHKCIPTAEHVVVANAGHGMHRDNAAAFDAAVLKFFSD